MRCGIELRSPRNRWCRYHRSFYCSCRMCRLLAFLDFFFVVASLYYRRVWRYVYPLENRERVKKYASVPLYILFLGGLKLMICFETKAPLIFHNYRTYLKSLSPLIRRGLLTNSDDLLYSSPYLRQPSIFYNSLRFSILPFQN